MAQRAILTRLRPVPGLRLESTQAHFVKRLPCLVLQGRAGFCVPKNTGCVSIQSVDSLLIHHLPMVHKGVLSHKSAAKAGSWAFIQTIADAITLPPGWSGFRR